MRFHALWACSLLLLSSCAGPQSSERSPFGTLTTENLDKGGLGVGGVVVADDLEDIFPEPSLLASWMRDAIIDTRQDFKVVSTEYIARAMGESSYEALLRSYEQQQTVRKEILDAIGPDFVERFRFLAFARIDRDSVTTHEQPASDETNGMRATEFITRRHLAATFQIYDVERHTLTATLRLTASADTKITRRDREYTPGTLSPRFPEPIDLHQACLRLFENFAQELPGFSSGGTPDEYP